MNKLIRICGLLLLWTGAALGQPSKTASEFRDHRLARIDDPLRVEFNAATDLATLRKAIAAGASAKDWRITTESAGVFELTRTVANKHSMKIALAYQPRGYTIRYLESINLLYDDKAQNMRGFTHRAIHRNYNTWVRELAAAINTSSGVMAFVSGGSQPNAAKGPGLPAPVPEGLQIVAPGPDAAPQAAAYSGQWAGIWSSNLQHVLVVERVEGRNAKLLYCHGTNASVQEPACTRATAAVGEDGVLRTKLSNGAEISYRTNADGRSVRGEYERNGRILFGTFEKVAR